MKKLLALLLLLPGMAWAACTSPAGAETDILYNGDFHTYQYCDGTNWQAIGGGSTSWYYLNAIPQRVQAVSNGTPFDVTGLTVTGTISGSSLISTSAGGTVSASVVNAAVISDTGGLLVAGQSSLANVSATAYQGNGALLTGVNASTTAAVTWTAITGVPAGIANVSNSTGSVTVTSVNAATGTFTNVAGTLTTAAQPNLTSTGTLTSVSDSGVLNVGGAISGSLTLFSGGLLTANAGVNVTGAVTATTTMASTGAMTAGGLFTASAGINATGGITATTTMSAPTISATGAGLYTTAISASALASLATVSTSGLVSNASTYSNYMREGVLTVAASASPTSLNLGTATLISMSITTNTTITTTNVNYAQANVVVVKSCQDGTGGRAITWPTNARFNSNTSPTVVTTANTCSLFTLTPLPGSANILVTMPATAVSN